MINRYFPFGILIDFFYKLKNTLDSFAGNRFGLDKRFYQGIDYIELFVDILDDVYYLSVFV